MKWVSDGDNRAELSTFALCRQVKRDLIPFILWPSKVVFLLVSGQRRGTAAIRPSFPAIPPIVVTVLTSFAYSATGNSCTQSEHANDQEAFSTTVCYWEDWVCRSV